MLVGDDAAVLLILQFQLRLNAVQLGLQVGGVQLAVPIFVVGVVQLLHAGLELFVHFCVYVFHGVSFPVEAINHFLVSFITNQKVEPLSTALSTPKAKPCCCKIAFVMDSPSPVPVRPLSCRAR